ncbi:MAG: ATP-binding protein [Firmicutes bacterium]|nr:ATP-binding protein [Bacillota bacterium]
MDIQKFFKKRILIVAGHYGSGKTEFAVSLAMQAAAEGISPLAVIDLDVVNPYFRSRECAAKLKAEGVEVQGSFFGHDVTAEIPELSANIRRPLEDESCRVIIDLGGNEAGARILKQFDKYFQGDDFNLAIVLNANRYETRTVPDAIEQIELIENELGIKADYLINNTHLLRETTADDIAKGRRLCSELAESRGYEILCDCYPQGIIDPSVLDKDFMPFGVGMYLRQSWLDK